MQFYLAPLQGLTDWIFREAFTRHISTFDKQFAPFIRIQNREFYRPSQCNDILPDHNQFQKPVPQFLGNEAESFQVFEDLCIQHGYQEVNINLGCPFTKVSGKGLGAGLLPHPDVIDKMLDEIFKKSALTISVKCRLGNEHTDEFEALVPVFNRYPLSEIIIHARIGKQQYKGDVDMETFGHYAHQLRHPVGYNGDICQLEDVEKVSHLFPDIHSVMIGRGIFRNPFLLNQLKGEVLSDREKRDKLFAFHQTILEGCRQKYSGDSSVLHRLTEMWQHHAEAFEEGRKIYKAVKKSTSLAKYEAAIFKAINEL